MPSSEVDFSLWEEKQRHMPSHFTLDIVVNFLVVPLSSGPPPPAPYNYQNLFLQGCYDAGMRAWVKFLAQSSAPSLALWMVDTVHVYRHCIKLESCCLISSSFYLSVYLQCFLISLIFLKYLIFNFCTVFYLCTGCIHPIPCH